LDEWHGGLVSVIEIHVCWLLLFVTEAWHVIGKPGLAGRLRTLELKVLIDRDLRWSVHFERKHERRSFFGDEDFGLLSDNIENRIIPNRRINKRNVHLRRKVLVDLNKPRLDEVLFLVLAWLLEDVI
jgi:hypothetical protein